MSESVIGPNKEYSLDVYLDGSYSFELVEVTNNENIVQLSSVSCGTDPSTLEACNNLSVNDDLVLNFE